MWYNKPLRSKQNDIRKNNKILQNYYRADYGLWQRVKGFQIMTRKLLADSRNENPKSCKIRKSEGMVQKCRRKDGFVNIQLRRENNRKRRRCEDEMGRLDQTRLLVNV